MFKLVYMDDIVAEETPDFLVPDVHWEEPEIYELIDNKPEEPQKVDNTPAKPEPLVVDEFERTVVIPGSKYIKPKLDHKDGFNLNAPIEHFLVTPKYPSRALIKGIEGYVELRFDVTETGATKNIAVVRAEPQGVFESAAIAAAERWKFQPKTEEGKPVYFRGLSKRVTFEMQKS
jgi:protein TonB